MNKHSSPDSLLGFPAAWENEILSTLNHRQKLFAGSIPPLELRSRVLARLHRLFEAGTPVRELDHLKAILNRIIDQVVSNHRRDQGRHQDHLVYGAELELLAAEAPPASSMLEYWDYLLGISSPLDETEKQLLREALANPGAFIGRHGVVQSAMARHLGVHQTTVRNRFLRIQQKLVAWRLGPDFPEELSL